MTVKNTKKKNKATFNGALLMKLLEEKQYSPETFAREIYKKTGVTVTGQSIRNHTLRVNEPRAQVINIYCEFFNKSFNDFF